MGKKDSNKPRGRMSSYAYFVQTCREEHKKKHPGEAVVFTEFTKKCAEKWKKMGPKEKKRFEEMADKDKVRYEREMSTYIPPKGEVVKGKKRRRPRDPDAPKRALSAFFFFCGEERANVKAIHPDYNVADVAKDLGKQWETCKEKPRYEAMAKKDKERYERENAIFKNKAAGGPSIPPPPPAATTIKKSKTEDDDDDDDDNDSDEED